MARLLTAWRAARWPVFHVRHDSTEAHSTYRPGQPGNEFKPEAMPLPGEPVIAKRVNSAFIGTDLKARLRTAGIDRLYVGGVITNNSVEAAGNLGFAVTLIEDACFTFARRDYAHVLRSAAEVHAMSLANLEGEYCAIATGDALLG